MTYSNHLTQFNSNLEEWDQIKSDTLGLIEISKNPSAFPNGMYELCSSKVDLICGVQSPIVSG